MKKAAASLKIGPPEWRPLQHAYERFRDRAGSSDLGCRDLYAALCKRPDELLGDGLPSALRQIRRGGISPLSGEEIQQLLDFKFWQKVDIFVGTNGIQVRFRGGSIFAGRTYFFVRAADLDRLCPAAMPSAGVLPLGFPVRDTRGKKNEFDWEAILLAGIEIMGRERHNDLASLRDDIYEHFGQTWKEGGPSKTQREAHLGPLLRIMKAVLGI